ncbi:MAG: hypothetical protein CENE_03450 [Candidatus Celerinatantimonas neptuna]|nr:MAG: hypothetical protein CENE_03450 [Candidatus Celerinatantimonas neptuna]
MMNQQQSENTPLYIGMPMWSHNGWVDQVYSGVSKPAERLARYAQVFNSVEGNTTFYAIPNSKTVLNWCSAVPDHFRFTFKLPKSITHQAQLRHCQAQTRAFFQVMSPLIDRTSLWVIQLSKKFGPSSFSALETFIEQFPPIEHIGLEVRHPEFFAKGDAEKRLNAFLIERGINRVMMDSRPVFSAPAVSDAVIDAHQKKPKLPVHAIATATQPMIRFIGHPDLRDNDEFFKPWIGKICQWLQEGRQPHLFIHTPDNQHAPLLAQRLYAQVNLHWQSISGQLLWPFNLPDLSNDHQLGLSF